MLFGAISNSWRLQLKNKDLADLVKLAEEKGAKHVELRQTCLGNYESGEGDDWRPNLDKLEDLIGSFPDLSFDLAVALPCVTVEIDPSGDLFQACLAAAKLLSNDSPHLRTVDPNASVIPWESEEDIPETAFGLVELTREAAKQGIILSMENSGQPIRSMHMLVNAIRDRLTEEEGMYLGLCPDPTNQLRRHPDSHPLSDLDALPLDMIKIVHFKQARGGEAYHSVATGDLDCTKMLQILQQKQYDGPAIMEIPPHENVFDNLAESFTFLSS
jgi:sugar phosphate isomerase/epimerase